MKTLRCFNKSVLKSIIFISFSFLLVSCSGTTVYTQNQSYKWAERFCGTNKDISRFDIDKEDYDRVICVDGRSAFVPNTQK